MLVSNVLDKKLGFKSPIMEIKPSLCVNDLVFIVEQLLQPVNDAAIY